MTDQDLLASRCGVSSSSGGSRFAGWGCRSRRFRAADAAEAEAEAEAAGQWWKLTQAVRRRWNVGADDTDASQGLTGRGQAGRDKPRTFRRQALVALASLSGDVLLQPAQLEVLQELRQEWALQSIWPTSARQCSAWAGVACDARGMVLELQLANFEARGTIPDSISKLQHLHALDLSYNWLNGTVPFASLAALPNLQLLNLSLNTFAQNLTEEIPPLPNLRVLDLQEADIGGAPHQLLAALRSPLQHLNLRMMPGLVGPLLPEDVRQLSNLTFLDMSQTGVTSLPKAMGLLRRIIQLKFVYVPYLQGAFGSLSWLSSFTGLVELRLTNTLMKGDLPEQMSLLSSLRLLDLSVNNFTAFPSWISVLDGLTYLNMKGTDQFLGDAGISALFPTELQSLTALHELDLSVNRFTGPLPPIIGVLTRLTRLSLSVNKFSGTVPADLSRLGNLRSLSLGYNYFTGTLPDLGSLINLTYLGLYDNELVGTLPAFLARLVDVVELNLKGNSFRGAIPQGFSSLTSLTNLDLSGNKLTAGLEVLLTIPLLASAWLDFNAFTGQLPDSFSNLTALGALGLSGNNLTGPFPTVLKYMTSLIGLSLDNNELEGPLPATISSLAMINALDLSYNRFNGTLPSQLAALTGVATLNLAGNQFSGIIPDFFSQLTAINDLFLNGNQLEGSIPDLSSWPTSLVTLSLGENRLTSTIPTSISVLSSLQFLLLSGNQLWGVPPPELARLPLSALWLADNHFSGPLPDAVANVTTLATLVLDRNNFSSSIPASWCKLSNLQVLGLGNNQLFGVLPNCIFNFPYLNVVDLSHNAFYGGINRNFRGMLPNRGILNAQANYFYGEPTVYAGGVLYCPARVSPDLEVPYGATSATPLAVFADTAFTVSARTTAKLQLVEPYKPGHASLDFNCFLTEASLAGNSSGGNSSSNGMDGGTDAGAGASNVPAFSQGLPIVISNSLGWDADTRVCPSTGNAASTQRSAAECNAFCSLGASAVGPCNGHGSCVPATLANNSSGGSGTNISSSSSGSSLGRGLAFVCVCEEGYVESVSSKGASTCLPISNATAASSGLPVSVTIGIALAAAVVAMVAVGAIAWYFLRKPEMRGWLNLGQCREFKYDEILAATNNWDKEMKLGEGAFGEVYKGKGPHGEQWAVKRAKFFTNLFEREVRAMAGLSDPNVVRLLGYCCSIDRAAGRMEQILVHEFMDYGDLFHHFGYASPNPSVRLTMRQRAEVAIGAARGISYMHRLSEPIVHRDIKPNNILLNSRLQAKVADFGLLKVLEEAECANPTSVNGTKGYIDPDYETERKVTPKSDVYSFGVVLLELFTGLPVFVDLNQPQETRWSKPGNSKNGKHIVDYVYPFYIKGNVDGLMDPCTIVPDEMLFDLIDLALECVKRPGFRRPDMISVVESLKASLRKWGLQADELREGFVPLRVRTASAPVSVPALRLSTEDGTRLEESSGDEQDDLFEGDDEIDEADEDSEDLDELDFANNMESRPAIMLALSRAMLGPKVHRGETEKTEKWFRPSSPGSGGGDGSMIASPCKSSERGPDQEPEGPQEQESAPVMRHGSANNSSSSGSRNSGWEKSSGSGRNSLGWTSSSSGSKSATSNEGRLRRFPEEV